MLKFLGWLFGVAFFVALLGAGTVAYVVWDASKDLPDTRQLAQYEPPVMTRMQAADGSLLAEYAKERRLYVPIQLIPKKLIQAYLSAEDKNFYQHAGLDWQGIAQASYRYAVRLFTGKGQIVGASTITQQVAKNFLLGNEQTMKRKLREALLVRRIESSFTKDQILELYLNKIFLGLNSYGVAAAALDYFGKSLDQLSLGEMAYLAALPKGPNNYHPFKQMQRALTRRNWVLARMHNNKYISQEEMKAEQHKPLEIVTRPSASRMFAGESFAEEVRRELLDIYGSDRIDAGGFSVRTTLNPKLQLYARQALTRGLIAFDRQRGFRGAVQKIDVVGDWGLGLAQITMPADIMPWRLAVVLEVSPQSAKIGLQPRLLSEGRVAPERDTGLIPLANLKWARRYIDGSNVGHEIKSAADAVKIGDVIYVAPAEKGDQWYLVQMPEVEGALAAMDPHTGRVLAMVGGFSYGRSQFNRAIQALRQPGSSFKPIVYSAALDNGYTPSSVVLDAPIEFKMANGSVWRPKNYARSFIGPSTLRRGIEKSRNVMTVRLASELGMAKVADLAERLGIYDKMPHQLAMTLGAGETSLLKMITAYSIIDNGGKRIVPTLIDRVQDRYGKTIFRHDQRECVGCNVKAFRADLPEPDLVDVREQIMSPYTAYQITSMMEGVVQRGTGWRLRKVGKPVAGKTGTSNDEKDAWFIGFTPDLTVGAYVGFDTPKPMGRKRTGGELAAPIVAEFMRLALRDSPATPFRVPRAIELIPINSKTGNRAIYGDAGVILEAFKPGDEPPKTMRVIEGKTTGPVANGTTPPGEGASPSPAATGAGFLSGTGGIY